MHFYGEVTKLGEHKMTVKTPLEDAQIELGFTGLEALTASYLSALQSLSEHKGFELGTLRQAGGTKIQVAQDGIDNVKRDYELVQSRVPSKDYSHLRRLADKMYQELLEVMVPEPR